MSDPSAQLTQTLRNSGQSLTRPRQIVFLALSQADPVSMAELVAKTAGQLDRSSVYRTVALFERLGIVQRLQMGWKYRLELSDAFREHHHHASCMHCGAVTELAESPLLEKQLHALAASYGFAPVSHQLEIRGLCLTCQQTAAKIQSNSN